MARLDLNDHMYLSVTLVLRVGIDASELFHSRGYHMAQPP